MVKASTSGAEDPGFESRVRRDFSGSSHTSDLKSGTPVATLLQEEKKKDKKQMASRKT